MTLWLSSRAALTNSAGASPLWNPAGHAAGDRLQALAEKIAQRGPDAVWNALDAAIARRARAFVTGIETYRGHPFRRVAPRVPVRWQAGAARLLDYRESTARRKRRPTVVIVPSLINRYYILDLLPERSFARYLAAAGMQPLVLDWGAPGEAECDFSLSDYIEGPLAAAVAAAVDFTGRPVALAGYCMGGLLTLAAALRRPEDVACLALLATPWDFHAERAEQARLLAALFDFLPLLIGPREPLPVTVIQSLFMALDPFLSERKFVRLADFDPKGDAARSFVALEDWINDGVPLARRVAEECARSWYRDNDPAAGRWRVAGKAIRPQEIAMPSLVVLPSRDRIVPPASAAALADAIPGASVLRPPFGHIGMMASATAPDAVWRPIVDWLLAHSS